MSAYNEWPTVAVMNKYEWAKASEGLCPAKGCAAEMDELPGGYLCRACNRLYYTRDC